jgi:hypothetical protein
MRAARSRNSLNQSRAATCWDFASKIGEIAVFLRDPGKQVQNWLKRNQSDRASSQTMMMKQKVY